VQKVFLWSAVRNRWTADRLQEKGLPHPDKRVLCDQEMEQRILTSCVLGFLVLSSHHRPRKNLVPVWNQQYQCMERTESKSWQLFYSVARTGL
jgi:hypothetical protein